jgi:hypothetical protein
MPSLEDLRKRMLQGLTPSLEDIAAKQTEDLRRAFIERMSDKPASLGEAAMDAIKQGTQKVRQHFVNTYKDLQQRQAALPPVENLNTDVFTGTGILPTIGNILFDPTGVSGVSHAVAPLVFKLDEKAWEQIPKLAENIARKLNIAMKGTLPVDTVSATVYDKIVDVILKHTNDAGEIEHVGSMDELIKKIIRPGIKNDPEIKATLKEATENVDPDSLIYFTEDIETGEIAGRLNPLEVPSGRTEMTRKMQEFNRGNVDIEALQPTTAINLAREKAAIDVSKQLKGVTQRQIAKDIVFKGESPTRAFENVGGTMYHYDPISGERFKVNIKGERTVLAKTQEKLQGIDPNTLKPAALISRAMKDISEVDRIETIKRVVSEVINNAPSKQQAARWKIYTIEPIFGRWTKPVDSPIVQYLVQGKSPQEIVRLMTRSSAKKTSIQEQEYIKRQLEALTDQVMKRLGITGRSIDELNKVLR